MNSNVIPTALSINAAASKKTTVIPGILLCLVPEITNNATLKFL